MYDDGLHSGCGRSRRPVRAVERHESVGHYRDDHNRRIPNRRRGCVRGSSWEIRLVFEYNGSLDILYNTHPRIVSRTLIQKSTPQPAIIKTPRGGTVDFVSGSFWWGWVDTCRAIRDHYVGWCFLEVFQVTESFDLLNKVMMIKQSVEQAPAMIVVVFGV